MESLLQDLRFGLRRLWQDRGFAVIALATLALGIGANSAVFSLVDGVLFRALPFREPDRLVAVSPGHSFMRGEYALARERMRAFERLAAYQAGVSFSVSVNGEAERVNGALASANLFRALGTAPLGRDFEDAEERIDRNAVVILSHRFWRLRYGADAAVLGRTLMIDGTPRTIVGITPPEFAFPDAQTDLWVPAIIDAADRASLWGVGGLQVIGRLHAGTTEEQAQSELHALGDALRLANPFWTPKPGYRSDNVVVLLHDALVGNARTMMLALLGAVMLVLLIACANVGNLLLARGLARERELALRLALGAGRARVVRQLITESAALAVLGGLLGLALGWLTLHVLLPRLPGDLPRLSEVGMDGRVLTFTLVASLMAGVAFGAFPALRIVKPQLAGSLAESGRTGSSARQRRLSSGLVVVEVALAVVLVTAAGLLLRTLGNLSRINPGFTVERVVSARLSPPSGLFDTPERRLAFYDALLERVRGNRQLQSVALTRQLPFDGEVSLTAAAVEFVANDPNELPVFEFRAVTPDFFRTLGIPLIEGRPFSEADRSGRLPVVIVDRTMAQRFWPGQSPIGKRLGRPWLREWRTVVGVVGAVRNNRLRGELTPAFYLPFAQEPSTEAVMVARTSAPLERIVNDLLAAVRTVDATVPVSDARMLDSLVAGAAARERAAALLVGAFAALAMMLGAVGLYGVLSYAVTQRGRELSVRMALGARPNDLLAMVLRDGFRLAALGLAIGIPAAWTVVRLLRSLLHGVEPGDPLNTAMAALILMLTCTAAALLPALRAVRVQPAAALR